MHHPSDPSSGLARRQGPSGRPGPTEPSGPPGRFGAPGRLTLLGLLLLVGCRGAPAVPSGAPDAPVATRAVVATPPASDPASGAATGDPAAAPFVDLADADFEVGVTPLPLRVEVLASHPHDPSAFTQGLIDYGGKLYESTGLNGRSSLRRVDIESGAVELQVPVDEAYFAEGLERVDQRLIQLTWQSGKAFVYDLDSFELLAELDYATEGWGLCLAEAAGHLVMSDGSDQLYFRDPETFEELGRVAVTRAGQPQTLLNELECVGQVVYANVWQTDEIVVIDPDTGAIGAVIDTAAPGSDPLLTPAERASADVLNGIVWLEDADRFLITGKLWPRLFEVGFQPAEPGG